jgi:hypothetical protein
VSINFDTVCLIYRRALNKPDKQPLPNIIFLYEKITSTPGNTSNPPEINKEINLYLGGTIINTGQPEGQTAWDD